MQIQYSAEIFTLEDIPGPLGIHVVPPPAYLGVFFALKEDEVLIRVETVSCNEND